MVKTPFFISPAYSVPRMTISRVSRHRSTLVLDVMPVVCRLAGNSPALKMTASGCPKSPALRGSGESASCA